MFKAVCMEATLEFTRMQNDNKIHRRLVSDTAKLMHKESIFAPLLKLNIHEHSMILIDFDSSPKNSWTLSPA